MKYFTADTHFFHKELIHDTRFANRMFFSVNDMNNTIVENWNSVVNDNDTVYHLGDIALINSKKEDLKRVLEILKKLKGQIVFLKGNHDSRALFKFIDKNNLRMCSDAYEEYPLNELSTKDENQYCVKIEIMVEDM